MVMAEIYTICGQYDNAIVELEDLLSIESTFTTNDLKLSRVFDPIRGLPRFKDMMKRYALTNQSI